MSSTRLSLVGRSRSGRLLGHLLAHPELAARVAELPALEVARLIHEVGLEDAGELLDLVATPTLLELLDEDLWSSSPDQDVERFDRERFVLWLEVLAEAGERALGERAAALSDEFLALALGSLVLVASRESVERAAAGDDGELLEKLLDGMPTLELSDWVLIGRSHEGWDAVVAFVMALDEAAPHLLEAVLNGLDGADDDDLTEDEGGLLERLSDMQALEEAARGEREERRECRGHVSLADARAFLRQSAPELRGPAHPTAPAAARGGGASDGREGAPSDPVWARYRRLWSVGDSPAVARAQRPRQLDGSSSLGLPALLGASTSPALGPSSFAPRLRAALAASGRADELMLELVFLVNVVLTAGEGRSRRAAPPPTVYGEHGAALAAEPRRLIDAARLVLEHCERGLAAATDEATLAADVACLDRLGPVLLFRVASPALPASGPQPPRSSAETRRR